MKLEHILNILLSSLSHIEVNSQLESHLEPVLVNEYTINPDIYIIECSNSIKIIRTNVKVLQSTSSDGKDGVKLTHFLSVSLSPIGQRRDAV